VNRWASGLVGAVVEAWAELRIHKTRVLLSLIGVAVAVTAITSVVGVGSIAQQAVTEQNERSAGRPAMLTLGTYSLSGQQADPRVLDDAFATITERYGIDYSSRVAGGQQRVQFLDGVVDVQLQAVDAPYGAMHRVPVERGAWFTDADENRLAPAIIVNEVFWKRLGSPNLASHPVVSLTGANPVTAVVVGVLPSAPYDEWPSMMMLYSAWERTGTVMPGMEQPSQFELWVPPEIVDELMPLIERDLRGAVGEGFDVSVNRQDYLAWEGGDPLLPYKIVVGGVAVLVLLLGALGLVNISLVTVRQRIREIGIRRSFGATAGRVFFAVMMESVVATVAAGVVGVALAILIVQNPWVRSMVGRGVEDLPPFPIEAAIVGLAASVFVGALAGLLPALVAVRVKVIDAIRY
jgi:putative ABC transport system permease protein